MSQGTRGRAAYLGLGMILCTGLVGCMEKDNKPIGTKPAGPGLPGTPMVQGTPKTGQPNWNVNGQPVNTGVGQAPVRPAGGSSFGTNQPGSGGSMSTPAISGTYQPTQYNPNVVPSVGPQSNAAPSASPSMVASAPSMRGQSEPLPSFSDVPMPPSPPGSTVPSVNPILAPLPPANPGPPIAMPASPGGFNQN